MCIDHSSILTFGKYPVTNIVVVHTVFIMMKVDVSEIVYNVEVLSPNPVLYDLWLLNFHPGCEYMYSSF
jgi:hypothetical protein